MTKTETKTPSEYRAYDTLSEWSGAVRTSREAAARDARNHNRSCWAQRGYGRAIVVTRDPEAPSRLMDLRGNSVWPPHGRGCGAARWRK